MSKSSEELIAENRPAIDTLVGKKNLIGVEIGTDKGYHALNMIGRLNIKKLYLVDPYICYPASNSNSLEIEDESKAAKLREESAQNLYGHNNIERLLITSEEAASYVNVPLDFVYIDGDHRYEMVLKDIRLWYPKVKIGGLVAGHDFKLEEKGVINAVFQSFGDWFKKDGWDWWVIAGKI